MAEWFKASVLKIDVSQDTGGSNPSLSGLFANPYRPRNRFAGWSNWLTHQAHDLKIVGSSPTPAFLTN